MQEIISVISLAMAAVGALATVAVEQKDKQNMASIVGLAFLLSFFINVERESGLILPIACIVFFGISVAGGIIAIFSNVEARRISSVITGIVCLCTSLIILFGYMDLKSLL